MFFLNEMLPGIIGQCEWSSPEARKKHIYALSTLVRLRNNGNEAGFAEYKEEIINRDKNTKCLVQQQDAADLFRRGRLEEAMEKLRENKLEVVSCDDRKIYEIRMLYWTSVVKRSQGDYKESQEICEGALQESHLQPNILIVPWIFYNKAKVLELEEASEQDCSEGRSLKTACLECYESAIRRSFQLLDFPKNLVIDLKQRVLIAMARMYLGAFYDGKGIVRKECSYSDIKHADGLLKALNFSLEEQAHTMTKLNEVERLLVDSERDYRRWEESDHLEFINRALRKSNDALAIAKEKTFKDAMEFAKEQIEMLTNLMQREEEKL